MMPSNELGKVGNKKLFNRKRKIKGELGSIEIIDDKHVSLVCARNAIFFKFED